MRDIPFGRPMIGEEERRAVLEVLSGPILVHGPRAEGFEAAFAAWTGASHAVSTSSCTAAMHLYWFDLGIGPGDEVLVPAQTHIATAHAVELTGARPVFVDCEPDTGNVNPLLLEEAVSSRTKAIAVVHYLGLTVDMDRVNEVARRHQLKVLEDCALAMGARYKGVHAGLLGDCGCFSFYPVKHMTTAEGGMLICRDSELAARIGRKKAFGVDRHMGERKIPGVYDVNMLGLNYRMNEIQAELGKIQLSRMDSFLAARRENYQTLRRGLIEIEEVELMSPGDDDLGHCWYCLPFVLKKPWAEKRYDVVKALNEKGVGTSIYYPRPVPHMSYYREKYGYSEDSFPQAARISYRSVSLPVGQHLNPEDMNYITACLKKAIMEVRV